MSATIAGLVASAELGDPPATAALFTALYAELHRVAERELARGARGATLGATTLLHEAYLELSAREGSTFPDRARFMAYASRVMRGLVIDYVRRRRAQKRGGGFALTSIDTDIADMSAGARDLQALSDALDALSAVDPPLAEVVDLRFFCGFTVKEIAALRGASERTVLRQWARARIFLHRALRGDQPFG